jgi:integrase
MAHVKLQFVNSFRNRHGTMVHYFRKRGCKSIRLRGIPGSPEFMRAYEAALGNAEPIVIGAERAKVGTVAATVGMMLGSVAFADLADGTQRLRRNILERFREAHGDKRIATIERKHVQAMVDAKAATPSAARNFLLIVRSLMKFAIKSGIRTDDPTLGVERVKIKSDGFITWEEHHIAAFEARHPIGTMPRLALALALGTGQRRNELVKMGRQHVRGDMIAVRQQKTSKPLMIPIGSELRAAIEAMPADRLTFITTARASRTCLPAFRIGFAIDAERPVFRLASPRMVYARRYAVDSPRLAALKKRSAPSAGTRRCGCCSATPRPQTRSTWRERRSNVSGTILLHTANAVLTHRISSR